MISESPNNKYFENIKDTNMEYQKDSYEILPEGLNNYDFTYKLVILGNSGVGKSCLTIKGVKNVFEHQSYPTVGFEFYAISFRINNKVVKLQIWDTCGQEVYKSLVNNFYRNSHMALMVYAINDRNSFEDISFWIKELKANCNKAVKMILIANKCDLPDRVISTEEGVKFKNENNIEAYFENTNKKGNGCIEIFAEAAKILMKESDKLKDDSKFTDQDVTDDLNNSNRGYSTKKNISGYDNNDRLPSRSNISLNKKYVDRDDRHQSSSGCKN